MFRFFVPVFLFCPALLAQDKITIYMTDVPSWTLKTQQSNSAEESDSTTTIEKRGFLVPKARNYFHSQKDCRDFTMTVDAEKASYAFVFGGRDAWDRNNVNVMVVNLENQEVIYAGDAIRFANVVKDACKAVRKHIDSK